jgi:hypothetical protein
MAPGLSSSLTCTTYLALSVHVDLASETLEPLGRASKVFSSLIGSPTNILRFFTTPRPASTWTWTACHHTPLASQWLPQRPWLTFFINIVSFNIIVIVIFVAITTFIAIVIVIVILILIVTIHPLFKQNFYLSLYVIRFPSF